MKKLKILTASLSLVLICSVTVNAFVPLVAAVPFLLTSAGEFTMAMATSITVFDTAISGGLMYYNYYNYLKPSSGNNGDISRPMKVTWVDITGVGAMKNEALIPLKVPKTVIQAMLDSNPTKYSNLRAAMISSSALDPTGPGDTFSNVSVGSVFSKDGLYYQITSLVENHETNCSVYSYFGNGNFTTYSGCYLGADGFNKSWGLRGSYALVGTAPSRPATIEESNAAINKGPTGVSAGYDANSHPFIASQFSQEIDDMIASQTNIMNLPDDNKISPTEKLPTPATYSAVAALARQQAAIASAQQADLSSSDATQKALNAVQGKSNYDSAKAASDSDPGDAAKLAATAAALAEYNRLQRASDAAKVGANADKSAADIAAQKAIDDKAKADDKAVTPTAAGAYNGTGDVPLFGDRVSKFMTDCKTSSLFSLPSQITAGIPSGGSSNYSFNCGNWGVISYDFANFAPGLAVLKTVILIMFGWVAFRIVTKGGA